MKKAFRRISALVMLVAMVIQPSSVTLFSSNPIQTSAKVEASGGSCLASVVPSVNNRTCNANDVSLANPTVTIINGCNGTSGDTATFSLNVTVNVTAQTKYDFGFWVSTNGGSPINGNSCQAGFAANTNGSCRDLTQGNTTVNVGTFTVQCIDTDNDGFLNVPVVTTWDNQNDNQCNTALETAPDNGAKCKLTNNLSIPVPVPPQTCTLTSNANACGQTSTTTGQIINNVCNAPTPTVPANPPRYGEACTKTSTANACGSTTTTQGTIGCDGTCNAPDPVAPANPSYYGTACTVTSDANACGQTTSAQGTLNCSKQCSATRPEAPANPERYGTACTVESDANACGQTTSAEGTYSCNQTCTAVKPEAPANPERYGTTCSVESNENACGETNSAEGTFACNQGEPVCNAEKPEAPANPERYGKTCYSEPNACGIAGEGTYSCNQGNQECSAVMPEVDPTDNNGNERPDCSEADITVTKTVDITSTYIGNLLTYSIVYQNLSSFIASNVSISDTLPDGVTLVGSSVSGDIFGNTLTWSLGNLAGNTSGIITLVVDTDNAQPSTISNTATISSENDIDDTNNTSTSPETTLLPLPPDPYVDLRITKVANTEMASIGSQIQYTINYYNDGNESAYNVSIVDTLPVGSTLVSASTTPTTNMSGVLTWEIGGVAAGASGSITITVDTDGMSAGKMSNTANIETACQSEEVILGFEESVPPSEEQTPPPSEEQTPPPSEEQTPPPSEEQTPPPSEEQTPPPSEEQTPPPSEEQTPPPSEEQTPPPSEEQTPPPSEENNEEPIIEEIPMPPMLLDVGPTTFIEETPVVLCDSNVDNNQSTASTELYVEPTIDMSISKSANTESVTVGGQITYTITYTNNGNSTAEGVVITDILPEGLTFVSSTPSVDSGSVGLIWTIGTVGAGESGTITVVVTANTVGSYSNAASVASRCYRDMRDTFIQEVDEEIIYRPVVYKGITCDFNESNDSTTSSPVSVNALPQGGQSFGGGFTPPVTQLLDTGIPQLLDTGAPQSADAAKKLTRGEAAKMLSEYYRNTLKQKITRTEVCNPKQYKDYSRMGRAMRNYIWDACSLGLMGWRNDRKTLLENFRAGDYVTKAEFAAVVSRMLYNTDESNLSSFRYRGHVYLLKFHKLIKGTFKANDIETRGNAEALLKLKK